MAHNRGRFPEEKLLGIEAVIVKGQNLEYKSFGREVIPNGRDKPMIKESMIHRRNAGLDVMEGYDPVEDTSINQHSIYHLYEYEYKTRFLDYAHSPRLEDFEEIKSRFLCCRYVICTIDDWMVKHKPAELLAIRKNGDIYIGANKSTDNVFPCTAARETAFGGLNFAKKVTEVENSRDSNGHHSVVKQWHVRNKRTRKSMTVFISSVARAFDRSGNVVELKTIGENVVGKLQNLQGHKARNWWLRALLSGANRIVYGVRMSDLKVNEVHEASLDDFTNGHFHFTETRLFAEVFKIFEKINKTLVNEGSVCLISLNMHEPVKVALSTIDCMNRSPFW